MPLEGSRSITDFADADAHLAPAARLDAVRRAAPGFRERLVKEGAPRGARTFDLASFPYPQRYGLGGVSRHPAPYAMIRHRCHVVAYRDWDGRDRLLLFNPTHVARSKAAPFFSAMIARLGPVVSEQVLSTIHATVEEHLGRAGLSPGAIDYIAFDHLHVQDLRAWLGTSVAPPGESGPLDPYFPRARLLVPERELAGARNLHPLQRHWYVEAGVAGIPDARIVPFTGDLSLGPGIALLATPGHTWGNQTLAIHHGTGRVSCVSENGISADNYAPHASRIPGLRAHARDHGVEVVMNANTLEGSLDQYTSMIKERIVAGPAPDGGGVFWDVMPSSELVASILAPGLRPTFEHRAVTFGAIAMAEAGSALSNGAG